MSKVSTTLAKNVSWLSLENAKLKVKLLKNQVRANQLTFRFCDFRILIFLNHIMSWVHFITLVQLLRCYF